MNDIALKTFGIKVKPPTLLLNYEADGKSKQLVVPIREFHSTSNINFVARSLKDRHDKLCVSLEMVEKMLKIIQQTFKGRSLEEAVETVNRKRSTWPPISSPVMDNNADTKGFADGAVSKTESELEANSSTKTEDFW